MQKLNAERSHPGMRCRSVSEWLPAYVQGRLPLQAHTRIARHIGRCPRCAVELADLRRFAAAIDRHGPVLLEDHPEAARLVEYVWNEAAMDGPKRYRIIRHLALCSTCRAEVKILRHLNESLMGASGFDRSRTTPRAHSSPETSVTRLKQLPGRRWSIWIIVAALVTGGSLLLALNPFSFVFKRRTTTTETLVRDPSPRGDIPHPPSRFTWAAVPDAQSYRVVLYDSRMIPIWRSRRSRRETAPLPRPVAERLERGQTYFWQVMIRLKSGKVTRSRAFSFTIKTPS